MDKIIIDERTGLTYELIGDYYFVAGEDEPPFPALFSCRKKVDNTFDNKILSFSFTFLTFLRF